VAAVTPGRGGAFGYACPGGREVGGSEGDSKGGREGGREVDDDVYRDYRSTRPGLCVI
jgi:hypothetical protein